MGKSKNQNFLWTSTSFADILLNMAHYYAYLNKSRTRFCKVSSLQSALSVTKGDESLVFKHAGTPNPWFVFPVHNGKVRKDILLKPSQFEKFVDVDHYLLEKKKSSIKTMMNKEF